MTSEVDEVLGTPPPPKRGPGRPRSVPVAIEDGIETPVAEAVMTGVSVSWLSQVFKMHPTAIRSRLETGKVQPLAMRQGKPVFSLREAAEWIILPKMGFEQAVRHMRSEDLPNHINVAWQTAQKVEQDVISGKRKNAEAAGDLWRTEKVMDVFGEVFMTIRDHMRLWVETLAENTDLSDDQRERLMQMVDALQNKIHKQLVELPNRRKTGSLLTERTISDVDELV